MASLWSRSSNPAKNAPGWHDRGRWVHAFTAVHGLNLWIGDLWFSDLSELPIIQAGKLLALGCLLHEDSPWKMI